ncbi:hypothetical protein I4U23_019921 [Adineta vaga]|nr:hypothetical protein I4U23_019921 [Adineta vaga]
MNNFQQTNLNNHQQQFQKFKDFLHQTSFTSNIPYATNYSSLTAGDKRKFLDEIKAIFGHILNIPPDDVPAFCRYLDMQTNTSEDLEN